MLGKRTRPMIGKITDLLVSGNRNPGYVDVATSPRSPLELKIQSPRGLRNYDLGGVGLAIVAALEKSSDSGCEILAKYGSGSGSVSNRSNPIPVSSCKIKNGARFEDLENYTYVTCRGPNNKNFTKVYCDGSDQYSFDRRNKNRSVFSISPAEDTPAFPTSDFLSSCHLCRKKLHGKDIYMYRGEKAFCSTECRQRQIVKDERKEKCKIEASRAVDVSKSSYTGDQIFTTGILAI